MTGTKPGLWLHNTVVGTHSVSHSGQGVARAVGGRETWLGCSFALSGRYRSPTDGTSTEHRRCPREFPELWRVP